jgi:hypothetical protein
MIKASPISPKISAFSNSEKDENSCICTEVRELLDKYPSMRPKDLCSHLHLSYEKYRDYVTNLRSQWKSNLKNELGSKVLKFHHVFGKVVLEREFAGGIRVGAVGVGWLATRARNRKLLWKDGLGHMEWFETGTVVLFVNSPATRGRAYQLFCNGFSKTGLISDLRLLGVLLEKMYLKGATATIETGQKLPYLVVDLFKTSNGIRIKTGDLSHPTCIEVDFCIPDWAERVERKTDELVGSFSSFAGMFKQTMGSPAELEKHNGNGEEYVS